MLTTLRLRFHDRFFPLAAATLLLAPLSPAAATDDPKSGGEKPAREGAQAPADAPSPEEDAGNGVPRAVTSTPDEAAVLQAEAEIVAEAKPIYRGSSISFGNAFTAIGVDRDAQITHNPYYSMRMGLAPRLWISDDIYTRASLSVATELTNADWTTDRFYFGDLGFGIGLGSLGSIPGADINVSGELAMSLPTSKQSRAATQLLATSASISFARALGGLSLSYNVSTEKYWNRHETGSPTGSLVGGCGLSAQGDCLNRLIHSGVRNASWSMTHSMGASIKPASWLGLSLNGGLSTAFLYPLGEAERASFQIEDPTDTRYYFFSGASMSVSPADFPFSLVLGAKSFHGQLRPNGSRRRPLLNRYTQVHLDLSMGIADLISLIES